MAGLLGKAAASNWKKATFGSSKEDAPVDWQSLSVNIRKAREVEERLAEAALKLATELIAEEEARSALEHVNPDQLTEHCSEMGGLAAIDDDEQRLYNPHKQKLQELGATDPANVSRKLLQELTKRSNIDTVLQVCSRNG